MIKKEYKHLQKNKFICSKCGKCCRNVNKSNLYKTLDRGDGQCMFLEEYTNLCSIYDTRPVICRVDEMYKLEFNHLLTKEEYYNLNYKACKILRNC
jgi:uncharacterized protein